MCEHFIVEDERYELIYNGPDQYEDPTWTPSEKVNYTFGCVPALTVEGKQIVQSQTIHRFVAEEVGLMGNDKYERAYIDSLFEQIGDVIGPYWKLSDTEAAKQKQQFLAEKFPKSMNC